MSKLAKYRKKITQLYGAELLKEETDYRVLKKKYIEGGTRKGINLCKIIINMTANKAKEANENHKNLLNEDANLNIRIRRDNNYLAPLHVFCSKVKDFGEEDVIFLVEKGADINIRCGLGNTPLYYALSDGNYHLVKYLIDNGADVDIFNKKFLTSVHKSFDLKDEPIMNLLLSKSRYTSSEIPTAEGQSSYLIYIIKNLKKNVTMETLSRLADSVGVIETKRDWNDIVIEGDSPLVITVKKIKKLNNADDVGFLINVFEEMLIWDESDAIFEKDREEIKKSKELKKFMKIKNR